MSVDLKPLAAKLLAALHLDSTATYDQIANAFDLILIGTPLAPARPIIHAVIVKAGPLAGVALLHAIGVDPKKMPAELSGILSA